jgi:2-dehydropantoate 2-reductase
LGGIGILKPDCKILIYGTGVIGSIYAVKLSNAGYDVSVYARGNRLLLLESKGLLYSENDSVVKASVKILGKLNPKDIFDYVFVPVKYEQIDAALTELATNNSPNIVTMVNNPKGYAAWENLVGKGRLIPAFAGAGGKIEDGVLHFAFTPKVMQSTTFGEVNGIITDRLRVLAKIFKSCRIPYSISENMDAWQKSHIALVVPLANGIYFDGGNTYTTAKNKDAIRMMSAMLKKNFNALNTKGIPIKPHKLNIFRFCPLWVMCIFLKIFCRTKLAETVASHVPYIRKEIMLLEKEFQELITEV